MSRDFILVFGGGMVSLITTLIVLFIADFFHRHERAAQTKTTVALPQPKAVASPQPVKPVVTSRPAKSVAPPQPVKPVAPPQAEKPVVPPQPPSVPPPPETITGSWKEDSAT